MAVITDKLHFSLRTAICRGPRALIVLPFSLLSVTPQAKLIFYDPNSGRKYLEIGTDTENSILADLSFSESDIGCDEISFTLSALPNSLILPRSRVDVHLFNDVSSPRYSGFVKTSPPIHQNATDFKYKGFGYVEQLDWVVIEDSTQILRPVSSIVGDLIRLLVEPYTDIRYNSYLIESASYVVQYMKLDNITAREAIDNLAILAGFYEYGVNENREFFFRSVSRVINLAFVKVATKHFKEFVPEEDNSKIINRYLVKSGELKESGDEEGTNVVGTLGNLASINKYGIRQDVLTAPSVLDDADALQWALGELNKTKDPTFSGKLTDVEFTNEKIDAGGVARINLFRDVPANWNTNSLNTIGTRVPGWDFDLIDKPDVETGQIFWEWANASELLKNRNFENWTAGPAAAPDDWTFFGDGTVAQELVTIKAGTSSVKLENLAGDNGTSLFQAMSTNYVLADFIGKYVTFGAWVWCADKNRASITISDSNGNDIIKYHSGSSSWEYLSVTLQIDSKMVDVIMYVSILWPLYEAYFDIADAQINTTSVNFAYEMFIKKIDYKFSTSYTLSAELGQLEDQYSQQIKAIDLRVKRQENLAENNLESLYNLP